MLLFPLDVCLESSIDDQSVERGTREKDGLCKSHLFVKIRIRFRLMPVIRLAPASH